MKIRKKKSKLSVIKFTLSSIHNYRISIFQLSTGEEKAQERTLLKYTAESNFAKYFGYNFLPFYFLQIFIVLWEGLYMHEIFVQTLNFEIQTKNEKKKVIWTKNVSPKSR